MDIQPDKRNLDRTFAITVCFGFMIGLAIMKVNVSGKPAQAFAG